MRIKMPREFYIRKGSTKIVPKDCDGQRVRAALAKAKG